MSALPSGTVTFLFTDLEGSTRLMRELGDGWPEVHAHHRRLLREAFDRHGGREIDVQGDAFFAAFARARDGVNAAASAQEALRDHEWPDGVELRARIGLHTGEPAVGDEGYLGLDVVRAARICAAAHGGQILLSETTRALLRGDEPEGVELRDLGEHRFKDLPHPERLFQLVAPGLEGSFPALRTLEAQAEEPDAPIELRPDTVLAERMHGAVRELQDSILRDVQRSLAGRRRPPPPNVPALVFVGTVVALFCATLVLIVYLIVR